VSPLPSAGYIPRQTLVEEKAFLFTAAENDIVEIHVLLLYATDTSVIHVWSSRTDQICGLLTQRDRFP